MLLRWVLTRDRAYVLTMADAYGSVQVEGDRVTRVRPESWDDVIRTYSINESLPAEEKIRTAIVKAEMEIIPAKKEIYGSLRGGALDGWARPNGSGDIVRIRPMDWTGLRFHSLDGRDIAIPVDSEYNPLLLPYPLAEYLIGTIPATTTPTCWPDPLFSAEQAVKLWPPHEPNVATSRSEQGPCAPAESAKALHEFDLRLGWICLTAALEIIGSAAGDLAWRQVEQAIKRKALLARCRADGVTRDLEPHWLDFLAWDRPDGDVLWFDREKAWRRAGRPTDRAGVSVPDRTDNVVVSLTHCAILWPDCAWPKASTAELVGDSAPRTLSLGTTKPPPSREKPFWPAARGAAFDWLIDNGCPEPGDGNQAKLEERVTNWLEDHGHEASEAAVRRHVVRWIKDRRAELNG